MFQNMKETQPDKAPEEPDSAKLPGCGLSNITLWLLLIFAFGIWLWPELSGALKDEIEITYSTFREQLKAGNVERITIRGEQIQGQLKEPIEKETANGEDEPAPPTTFVTYLPSFGDDRLLPLLEAQAVEVETQPQSDFSWLAAFFVEPFAYYYPDWAWLYVFQPDAGARPEYLQRG